MLTERAENNLETLRKLNAFMRHLPPSAQQVARSLFNWYRRKERLSDAQWGLVHKLIAQAQEASVPPALILVPGLAVIQSLLAKAAGKQQNPCIRLKVGSDTVKLYQNNGGQNVAVVFDYHRVGIIDGNNWIPTRKGDFSVLLAALLEFATKPEQTAKNYGKETGSCCFCGLTLTHSSSVSVGYGPICAENYGLPWGGMTHKEMVELNETYGEKF